MPEVSIYVALIAAGAAAVPYAATAIRDGNHARRDRRERRLEGKRQACLELLRVAGDQRTQVANTAQYHGPDMSNRLAEIRECAAAIDYAAAKVGLTGHEALAQVAEKLAVAARDLAAAAIRETDLILNQMVRSPDFTEFDNSLAAFRATLLEEAGR